MAYIQKDRVKETTTTTGTGAITLAGAVAGFQAFSAVMSVADTCYYVIVSATGTDWETGTGTYSAASVLTRTTVLSSSNSGNAVNFGAGTKDVFMGPIAESVNDIAHGGTGATTAAGARTNLGVSTGTVTSVAGAGTVSGLTLTGTVTSSGSLTLGGSISTLNQNTTGNAATVTTNANLTGHVTSSGNAAVLGSFTSAQLASALSDETGTGAAVFATSPTLVTPLSNTLSAIPVASGAGNSLTIAAGSGVTSGAGGSLILQAGIQATSGGDGKVIVKQVAGQTGNIFEIQNSAGTVLGIATAAGRFGIGTGITIPTISVLTIGGAGNQYLAVNNATDGTHTYFANVSGRIYLGSNYGSSGRKFSMDSQCPDDSIFVNLPGSVGIGTTSPSARTHIVTAAAVKGLIVQGAASQTANLQEWQDSTGTVLSVSAAGAFSFPSTTTAIAVNTDNLVLTGSAFQRINCTTASNLTGIAPPSGGTHVDGRMIRVYNVGTANLTLVHNATSTAANRFFNSTLANIILAQHDYAELIYDITDNGSIGPGWRVS